MTSGLQSRHHDIPHCSMEFEWWEDKRPAALSNGVRIYLGARSLFDGREFTRPIAAGGRRQ
jgi:hypothetical protein